MLSAIITASAAILYSARPTFWCFMGGEILWALGTALMSGADQALLYDSLKADGLEGKSKDYLGRLSSVGIIALTISAPIGSFIGATLGLRYAVMLMAVPMSLAMFAALALKEPPRNIRATGETRTTPWETFQKGFGIIRQRREIQWLVAELLTVTTPSFFVIWTYQLRLKELAIPLALYGWVHAAMCAFQALLLSQLSRVECWTGGKSRYLLWSALVPALSFLILGFSRDLTLNIIAMVLISGFGLSRRTLVNSYLHEHFESDVRATAMSTVNMISRLLLVVIYPLVGFGVEHSLTVVFFVLGGLMIVSRIVLKAPNSPIPAGTRA
jgi:predicted MFS family arabinose efflux permease